VKKSLIGLDSWIAAAEEVSLQTASEGGKIRISGNYILIAYFLGNIYAKNCHNRTV